MGARLTQPPALNFTHVCQIGIDCQIVKRTLNDVAENCQKGTLEVPEICRRDGCGGAHYDPVTGSPPDYHFLTVDQQGNRTLHPRWRNRWRKGEDRANWWYAMGELAVILGVHPQTIRQWLKEGRHGVKLKGTRITGQWRVRGADLEEFMRATNGPRETERLLRQAWG